MQIDIWPIDQVKPYDKNPRLNDGAVAAVATSIRQFGFRQPIVVDPDGVIICGHTRWKASKQLGLERVPVHVARDLTPEQIRAYRIADNKTHELSEWNMDLLPIELLQLKEAGIEWTQLGFDVDELAQLIDLDASPGLSDPDEVPAPPDEATTQPGDLWVLGDHRLLCGDSTSTTDVDRLLGGQTIHLVNTDPPYNVKVEPRSNNAIAAGLSSFPAPTPSGEKSGAPRRGGLTHHQGFDVARQGKKKATTAQLRAKDRPLANDFVSDAEFDRLLDGWFGILARVLEPGRGFYIWGGYANCANYPPVLKRMGLYFSQAIIWVKEHPVLTRKDFMGNHEWCFYGWREGAAHVYLGPNNATDVWSIKKVNPQSMVHLPQRVYRLFSGRQAKVLQEQAVRHQIPVAGATVDLFAILHAFHDLLARHRHRLASAEGLELVLNTPKSPALERYREIKVKMATLELGKMERTLLLRDDVHYIFDLIASTIRRAGELVGQRFGEEAREILDECLSAADHHMKTWIQSQNQEIDGAENREPNDQDDHEHLPGDPTIDC